MKSSSKVFRVGTRNSNLALTQTSAALARMQELVPAFRFEMCEFSSPGDRDRKTDLRRSDPDFFTRDLDEALCRGDIDAAVHSAKDVPQTLADGLDWVWLPWGEDARDAWVLAPGRKLEDLPACPRIGVSSDRRQEYSTECFPSAQMIPIRGNIDGRLAQLDAGDYDAVIMASAALIRLGLSDRITAWIPLASLPSPEGQGRLCMTFRANDTAALRLRSLFVKAAVFAGAGVGNSELCTVAAMKALERCDICLYDALLDSRLLQSVPPGAERVSVGKRSGMHSVPQEVTTRMIADEVRKGKRVVRLKGGDPGMFGRLAEEVDALDALSLPYRVIPGISSMSVATTATGLLLTRRGVSRGFSVLTPRKQGGAIADISAEARAGLPLVFFMAGSVSDRVAKQLIDDGMAPDTPAAFVVDAGGEEEEILRYSLGEISEEVVARINSVSAAVLFIVGSVAKDGFPVNRGALQGRRVLLTCSEELQSRAAALVRDYGGIPLVRPLVKLSPVDAAGSVIADLASYDWLVVTSPSAVRVLLGLLKQEGADIRTLPRIITCGPATAQLLKDAGIYPMHEPCENFGAEGLVDVAKSVVKSGERVVRVRSDKAGPALADAVKNECGAEVTDAVIYQSHAVRYDELPKYDMVFFASGSSAEAFVAQWGNNLPDDKITLAIGGPTAYVMAQLGLRCDLVSREATVDASMQALAAFVVGL